MFIFVNEAKKSGTGVDPMAGYLRPDDSNSKHEVIADKHERKFSSCAFEHSIDYLHFIGIDIL